MYQLKATSPDFRVVDGQYAGRQYVAGQLYEDIPPQEAHKFEKVPESAEQTVKSTRNKNKDFSIGGQSSTVENQE